MVHKDGFAGPILHFRGCDAKGLHLAAITVRPRGASSPGALTTQNGAVQPVLLAQVAGLSVWRHDFTLAEGEGVRFAFDDSQDAEFVAPDPGHRVTS